MNRPGQVIVALSGVAATALGAYLLDPDNGRRRRSQLGDRCKSAATDLNKRAHSLGDDLSHRYKDMSFRARSWFTSDERSDRVLERKVKVDLWRAVPDTQRIGVIVHDGDVILHGDVLASEHGHVLEVVRAVEGVRNVTDHLSERAQIERPTGPGRLKQGYVTVRNNLIQEKWTPPTRVCGSTVGLALMGWGARHRNAAGIIGALVGAALVLRSASNMPFARMVRRGKSSAEAGLRSVTQDVKDAAQDVKDEAAHLGNAAASTASDWRARAAN